ncbi:DUF1707 SHOCT-like domain-containing protein [Sciscionella marina]|uniref:DUF1707 SHOCT-like domain-containing protein n=1 Tax=Sciscionella marina TaxID=508770 RepID=UPI0012F632E8|nr:DUF1707 domain-containing protein [Sciscionella marina]
MMRNWRASDAERQAILDKLQYAVGEGRITMAEFEQRAVAVWRSRTIGELDELIADLPHSLW